MKKNSSNRSDHLRRFKSDIPTALAGIGASLQTDNGRTPDGRTDVTLEIVF